MKTLSNFKMRHEYDKHYSDVNLFLCTDGKYCLSYKYSSMKDYKVFMYDDLSIAQIDYIRSVLFLLSERI